MRNLVNKMEEGLLAFLLAAMVVVTFSQVVARYVFNSGAVWALELTTFLFAWLILLGASYGIRTNAHIGVDAFVRLFSTRVQRLFGLAVTSAMLAYGVFMLAGSSRYVGRMYEIGIAAVDMPIPRWIPLTALPLGFILIIYRILELAWRIARGHETGLTLGDEGREAMDQFAQESDGENRDAPDHSPDHTPGKNGGLA